MNTLIMTVGLPRSGKSTWAKKQNLPIVCPDAIRYALHGQRYIELAEPMVWTIAKLMVRALFLAGHSTVILDATNTSRARRDEWRDPHWQRVFKVIDTDCETCIARATAEGDDYIKPIIARMAATLQPLDPLDEVPYQMQDATLPAIVLD